MEAVDVCELLPSPSTGGASWTATTLQGVGVLSLLPSTSSPHTKESLKWAAMRPARSSSLCVL